MIKKASFFVVLVICGICLMGADGCVHPDSPQSQNTDTQFSLEEGTVTLHGSKSHPTEQAYDWRIIEIKGKKILLIRSRGDTLGVMEWKDE